ncbi:MAG: hypothetical protein U5O39_10305 [Gammaproteobacteria bacterium]|nr:hypothetical protein [Gammaproteobacteria bacterium]
MTDGKDALVRAPRDVGKLSQAILDLLRDADLRDRLGSEGQQTARQLDRDRAAASFETLMKEVMGGSA